jgi:hypothetical protein
MYDDDPGVPAGLEDYDPIYFSTKSWDARVIDWLHREPNDEFVEGNRARARARARNTCVIPPPNGDSHRG